MNENTDQINWGVVHEQRLHKLTNFLTSASLSGNGFNGQVKLSLDDKIRLPWNLHVVSATPLNESYSVIVIGASIWNEIRSIREESEIGYSEQCELSNVPFSTDCSTLECIVYWILFPSTVNSERETQIRSQL
jgi:hypothetical protein